MANEYLRQSDLRDLTALTPEEEQSRIYAEQLADQGGVGVSLEQEIARAKDPRVREALQQELANRGGNYARDEWVPASNPVSKRRPQGMTEISKALLDGVDNDALNELDYDKMLDQLKGSPVESKRRSGLVDTVKGGFSQMARSLGAAVDLHQGDVEELKKAGAEATADAASKDKDLAALLEDIQARKTPDAGWLETGKALLEAAANNPRGAGLLIAEQLPNSAAVLGAAGAGAAAGSLLGPVGTVAGGIFGMFGANYGLEGGGKAVEAAQQGRLSQEDLERVKEEGLIKAGVITGVDAATFGIGGKIAGTAQRAVDRAGAKVLQEAGVNVADRAAIIAAIEANPALVGMVQAAEQGAYKAATTLGQRAMRGGAGVSLETLGEGIGEYYGEGLATGNWDKMEALIEAFSSLGQSAGEVAINAARNKVDPTQSILNAPDIQSAIEAANNSLDLNQSLEQAAPDLAPAVTAYEQDVLAQPDPTGSMQQLAHDEVAVSAGAGAAVELGNQALAQNSTGIPQDDGVLREWLRNTSVDDLTRLLLGADQATVARVVNSLSDRAGQMVLEDLAKAAGQLGENELSSMKNSWIASWEIQRRQQNLDWDKSESQAERQKNWEANQIAEQTRDQNVQTQSDITSVQEQAASVPGQMEQALSNASSQQSPRDQRRAAATQMRQQLQQTRDSNRTVAQQLSDNESGQFSQNRTSQQQAADVQAATAAPTTPQSTAPTIGRVTQDTRDLSAKVKGNPQINDVTVEAMAGKVQSMPKLVAHTIQKLGKMLGRRVVFFSGGGVDGTVFRDKNDNRVFVSADSSVNPIRVLGHEMMHRLKTESPVAYAALRKALRDGGIITDEMLADYDRDYNGDAYKGLDEAGVKARRDAVLAEIKAGNSEHLLEEMLSDLNGNRFMEAEFWSNVFQKIEEQEGREKAKGIIAKLREALTMLIGKLQKALAGSKEFDADKQILENLQQVRAALEDAFATYMGDLKKAGNRLEEMAATSEKAQGTQAEESPQLSPRRNDPAWNDALKMWLAMSSHNELFKYPKSERESMQDIFADIMPGAEVAADQPLDDRDQRYDVVQKWLVTVGDGRKVTIYQDKNGDVWVNALGLKSGKSEGAAVYAALLNYTHNNMLRMVGDPLGVSDLAVFRRTENMLASALKFGTTDHMMPADEQARPEYFENQQGHLPGVTDKFEPLKWEQNGDHLANLTHLLYSSYSNVKSFVPEIENVTYNFASRRFEWADSHRLVAEPEWQVLSQRLRDGLSGVAGDSERIGTQELASKSGEDQRSATLQRAALTNTLLREASGEGRGSLLATVRSQLQSEGLTPDLRRVSYSKKREHDDEVSPRRPVGMRRTEDPVADLLQIDYDAIRRNPEGLKQQMSLVTTYPNYREAPSAKTPEQKAERFIQHLVSNLSWLYEQVPQNIRERSHLWYDGANKIAKEWAGKYGLKDSQIAGVMAVLSPQKDWYTNVSLAQRVLDIWTNEQSTAWSQEMTVTAERIFGKEQYQLSVDAIRGKKLSELSRGDHQAMWIRTFDETHNSRHFRVVTPEGDFADMQRNFPSKANPSGALTVAAWGSLNSIAKATSVIKDGSLANIDEQLGNEHKVRSFYNNILVPNSKNGHVTIDTHAVAAALLRPLSGNSTEVAHNFGGNEKGKPGPGGSKIIGYSGTYGLYAEAYRRAAEKFGVLPRELQSITWEAVRGLFERENKKMMDFDPIWADFKKGKVSLENTRNRISEAAGGIRPPTWFGRGARGDEAGQSSADASGVADEKLSGRSAEPAAGGDRSADSSGASLSKARVNFEVAPDPNDAALSAAWSGLSQKERRRISSEVAEKILPRALRALGTEGKLTEQVGSYLEDTNPSFALLVDPDKADEAARYLGYVLSQDSMIALSDKPFRGAEMVGAVTIDIGEADPEKIYGKLREIEVDGSKPVGGQSTVNGQMMILNYSDVSTDRLAEMIDKKLGGKYNVNMDDVYASFPNKEEYGYGSDRSQGQAASGGSSAQGQSADHLRREATGLIRDALRDAGVSVARSDAAGDGRNGSGNAETGRALPEYGQGQEGSVSVVGQHWSKEQRNNLNGAYYGTGLGGAERPRVMAASDRRLRSRIYFYVPKDGVSQVTPEAGVGSVRHDVRLNNLYDANESTDIQQSISTKEIDGWPVQRGSREWLNLFESAVIDAGYDGYVSNFGDQRAAVLIGPHVVDLTKDATDQGGVSLSTSRAQTDTPEFKRWFGNWAFDPKAKVSVVDGGRIGIDPSDTAAIRQWLMSSADFKEPVRNLESGVLIEFTTRGLKDSLKRRGDAQRNAYSVLRDLIESAHYVDHEQSDRSHLAGQDIYYGALQLDGRMYSVRIKTDVRTDRTTAYKDHRVDEIITDLEITPAVSKGGNDVALGYPGNSGPTQSGVKVSLGQLVGNFKPAASKVVDADGKPLVVYHGTGADVTEFAKPSGGKKTSHYLDFGFHFGTTEVADRYATIAQYGGRLQSDMSRDGQRGSPVIYPVYLSAQNIADITAGKAIPDDVRGALLSLAEDHGMSKRSKYVQLVDVDPINFLAVLQRKAGRKAVKNIFESAGYDGIKYSFYGDSYVVFSPTQIKSATGNRGTFDPANPDIRMSTQRNPVFFSQLERQVEAAPDRMFSTGKQTAAWLQSNAAKLGIKKDELQWSGVMEWLATQGKVTKADVLNYLAQGGVRVEEVMNGADTTSRFAVRPNPSHGGWQVRDPDGNWWGGYATREQAEAAGHHDIEKNPTKYAQWQLPGGEDYRELLLTLPKKKATIKPDGEKFAVMLPDGRRFGLYSSLADAESALNRTDGQIEPNFQSSHWSDTKNILAHIRFNTRTDADGAKVLFIEEIQSDWGQQGKKEGFALESEDAAKQRRAEAKRKADAILAGRSIVALTHEEKVEWNRLQGEASESVSPRKGVAPAPFVTDTKSWVALALKRIMRYAADNGFEKIAFVNGDQSADRYDLSKQVDEVFAFNVDGAYNIVARKDGMLVTEQSGITEKSLPDVVGKDLAEKIIDRKGGRFSGVDLKVGGLGMKSFYNEIVPQVANDLLKKMGGKMETVRFNDFESKNGAADDKLLSDLGVDVQGTRPAGQPGFTVPAAAAEPMALFSTKRDRANIETALRRMDKFVDAFEAGEVKSEDTQLLGPTPVVLRAIGAQEFEMEIDGAVLEKTLKGKHRHAITADLLKQLPEGIYDPTMVFAQKDGALLITDLVAETGNPVVAAVHFRVRSGRLLVNRIATAHEFDRYIERLDKIAGDLRYVRNEKGLAASTKPGQLVLPDLVQKARDLGANILTEDDLVKLYGARYSTQRIIGNSGRQYSQEQQRAFDRTGRIAEEKNLYERVKEFIAKRWQQGIFDQFAPFRNIDMRAYTLMRLSKGATGAMEALMHHGKLSLRDGTYDADTSGGVIEKVFAPIGKESTDFLYWVAGNRAERLKREGKENLMDDRDIQAFKALDNGVTDFDYTLSNGQVTRDRTRIYADTLKKFNAFNKNVLDMAEQSGLIDPASRQFWEHEFYVPFYRVLEEQEISGGNIAKGVVRQKAFEKLKGGTGDLNDLLANTLMNWHHLIDAGAKNRAAKAAVEAADRMGIAHRAIPGEKKTVWFMDNGQKREYKVDDPAVMEAITGLEYAGMRNLVMDVLTAPKHWLTVGVTASPFFKIRNLIRDSVQAIATSDLSYNPIKNVVEGAKLTNRDRQEYVSALAGGGLIRFGTMLEGNEAARTRQLIKKASKDGHILQGEGALQQFYDKWLEPAVMAYNELGNRGEEINRMSLYDQLIKQGIDHATASLMARDLMDFSLQGSFTTIRFLAQVVPFFNARLQGMYKLGRATKENRSHMATVVFTAALASLALMALAASDDDSWKRWKKREEWDKANYWWFEFAGVQFRIPKPFELGAVAHIAERSVEAMFDSERDAGKRYGKAIMDLAWNQLSMSPVPQAIKPIVDLYANKDSFTGRPIETMGMQRLAPTERYTSQTSMPARLASEATFGMLSPVQYDHIVRSYFGWLGATAVGSADMIARSINNEPTKPALDYFKFATGGMVQEDQIASRYTSMMYEQAAELEQAHATYARMLKEGRREDAKEFAEDNADKLKSYHQVENVKKRVSQINERIRMIERSDLHPAEKRIKIRALKEQASDIAAKLSD